MMKNLTIKAVAEATGGRIVCPEGTMIPEQECSGVVIDNRQVEKDYCFVPIKGSRVDGHDFIPAAFEAGALFTLAEHELENAPGPYVIVNSTPEALKQIATYYRRQIGIPVIGIIGSVGKTSTKEMVASVLSQRFLVLKTEGNFNNEIGLPLTLLKVRKEHEAAVVEMGISDFGEMHRLGEVAKPDVVIFTNIGECHLENLHDRDGVLKAKTEVFAHLSAPAKIILNTDDDRLATVGQVPGALLVPFGIHGKQAIHAENVRSQGLDGVSAEIHTPNGSFEVSIPLPGTHNIYNALAGTAAGLQFSLSLEEIKKGIETVGVLSGRGHFISLNNDITLIDDCYNANPQSMRASLSVLSSAEGRKIAVLGDMGELGENEEKLHFDLGVFLAKLPIDHLFTVGKLSKHIADAVQQSEESECKVHPFETKDAMIVSLVRLVEPGDTVLLKASHFMEFSTAVDVLKENLGEEEPEEEE